MKYFTKTTSPEVYDSLEINDAGGEFVVDRELPKLTNGKISDWADVVCFGGLLV